MEAAGVALAILPLVINQLDNYVQGLETIKSFGAKRYRRELESYSSSLGTQQAIFVNTLERALDGVVEYEDGLDELRNNPLGNLWKRQSLQTSLHEKLGRDFYPFNRMMIEVATLLEELSRKLGLDKNVSVNHRVDQSAIKKEVKKFKDIFSKSIYLDVFARLDAANKILNTLVEQSDYRSTIQKQRISKRPLLRHKRAQKSARSLHNAIIRGKYWKCACMDQHSIYFVLSYPPEDMNDGFKESSHGPRFRMIFPSNSSIDLGKGWCEIEAESDTIQSSVDTLNRFPPQSNQDKVPFAKKKPTVRFAFEKSSEDKSPMMSDMSSVPPIVDICSTLSTVGTSGETNAPIGFISDENHRHNMYYVRKLAGNLRSQSLAELIAASSDISKAPIGGSFLFTWGHRLRVAVNLACSVLQFHGSWLKTQWRSRDIMFTKNASGDIDKPYVLWNVGSELDAWSLCRDKPTFSLIQSEILFPLGLVLIELSLCQTLEALRMPEDDDPVEAYVNLKTATRLLQVVEGQSGADYEKVARRCLLWPGTKDSTLESEQMQDEIFQLIISPLIEYLRSFEGRG
ncbi:hypothetical protein N7536_004217 [Penicillium majusculum]|uniref:DUF7580 domain-containing protein n=1 Tax=Penicillium solitum TaxID=60172 RepID=A0A1V6QUS1_9EURO|nr:uncharacterized protein PENSOL_c038G05834 [Penicillium solitum]KAJ5693805.1 hypothetical protein N7536_004217 [Penicillium majusculum]OQD92702.1 hypothetical protein PENSOL_c038G05834 [Penicillium solitum]